jgi:hypothetical protein
MVVDSLRKVKEVLSQASNINGRDHGTSFSGFSFLDNWLNGKMSREDKDRYFSSFSSHELHLFLRKHDAAYFQEVVQPFIKSKLVKTFVDHYLLDEL